MKIVKYIITIVGLTGVLLSPLSYFAQAVEQEIGAIKALPPTEEDDDEEGDDAENSNEAERVINSLILVDESAYQVLDLLEKLTEKTILRQGDLPKIKINLNSNGPITQTDAILAIESLLSMNGIAVVDMGEPFLKAVPAAGVQTQSPKLITGLLSKSRPSQKIYSKIFKLKYLSTKEGLAAITGMSTKNIGSQVALEKSNAIFVVDTLMNLQRMETLFEDMDKPLALQEELLFYPIQYVNASDLKNQFEAMKKGNLKKYLESTTIEADKNSNQLIVLTHANNKPLIDKMIDSLDVDVQPLHKSQVIRLQYAEAKEVAALLKALIKGVPMPKTEGETRAQLLEKLRETVAKPGQPHAGDKGHQFSETLTLEPDERSNAVVVYGTPKDLELTRGLINELDVLLAQVRIEVIIAEVTLTDGQVCGLQTFGFGANVIDPAIPLSGSHIPEGNIGGPKLNFHNIFTPTIPIAGITTASVMAATISKDAFNAIFRVVERNSNVRILSTPMVTTTHNRKATVKVVRDIPYAGNTLSESVSKSTTSINSTVEYYNDVGIVLEVTPRIGPNGVIQMEIKQNVRTLVDFIPIGNSQTAPEIANREAESFISVQDQEVIVLAGLQQRLSNTTKGKLWGIGYIPIIGDLLFSPKTVSDVTTELIMFIRPHVMNNMDEVAAVACETLNNNLNSRDDLDSFIDYGHFPRPEDACEPPVKTGINPCDSRLWIGN